MSTGMPYDPSPENAIIAILVLALIFAALCRQNWEAARHVLAAWLILAAVYCGWGLVPWLFRIFRL